jgi:hypothetical protein
LVRHPKKKENEKKPDDTKKPDSTDTKDTPPGASGAPATEEVKIRSGLDRVFWVRVALGILAGALSAEIGYSYTHASSRIIIGFAIMITLFIVSYGIAKALRIPIPPTDKKKLVMTGIGSYFLMFLFSWILTNTIIHPDIGLVTVR